MVNAVLSHLEKGQHRHHPRRRKRHHHSLSDSSSSDDEKELLKESGHRRRARVEEVVQEDPSLFGLDSPDTITTSQVLLLAGFFLSLITWAFAYWRTILGGATGDTLVKLAQPNCTPGLGEQTLSPPISTRSASSRFFSSSTGNVALLVVYAVGHSASLYLKRADLSFLQNTLFMILAIVSCFRPPNLLSAQYTQTALQVLLAAMSIMNLLDPSAKCLGRTSTAEYHGSQKLVFGASLLVWVVWFVVTFYIWFAAGQANLLASLEFGWSFGTTFSILSTSLSLALVPDATDTLCEQCSSSRLDQLCGRTGQSEKRMASGSSVMPEAMHGSKPEGCEPEALQCRPSLFRTLARQDLQLGRNRLACLVL